MMHADYTRDEAGRSLSWGAVFAGVVTFIALLITLSMVGSALGFGQFNPTQPNAFEGIGMWQAIWLVVEFILAFLGAGFIAGATARRAGHLHGFLTWGTSLIAFVVLLGWLTMSALSAAGTVLNVGGQAVGSVAQTASDAVSNGISAVSDNISVNQEDIDSLTEQVNQVLVTTDVPELQPEYLSDQMDGATSDIGQAAKDILVNPENADTIISETQSQLEERVNNIAESVDRDAVANAIAQNTTMTPDEATQATDNLVEGYQTAAEGLRNGIQTASQQLSETATQLQADIDRLANNAKAGANEATNTISKGFIWVFVGLIIGAALSTFGGTLGVNFSVNSMHEQRAKRYE